MMEPISSGDKWQRIFYVTDHVKHKKGFILFKIVSVVYFKGQPEAATKIIVWKHYNQVKKLHRELREHHKRLRISEPFPSFYKRSFFHRYSDDVIEQQKTCILSLLQFVSRHISLFTADVFVKFFQEGYDLNEVIKNKDIVDLDNEDADVLDDQTSLNATMGQVLQSEGSQSSDESVASGANLKKYKHSDLVDTARRQYKLKEKMVNSNNPDGNLKLPLYWEEAIAHGDEASQQEMLGNHEVAFAMYKTAIVCLLSGIQGDNDSEHRTKVKEKTSQYLMKAEWIYNNHLVLQARVGATNQTNDIRIPWRSRSQMTQYKVLDIIHNNMLVHDSVDDILVVVKGVLKSSCPLDRSGRCILPKDLPYMVKLYGIHENDSTVFFVLEHVRYGRLWDHLEHYFSPDLICDNAESEITCVNHPNNNGSDNEDGSNEGSLGGGSSNSYNNSLSRLESSMYTTDTLSCESLNSSRDDSYFDLIEDYARVKNQKLREIQDFHERQKHTEKNTMTHKLGGKKTASQLDLKFQDNDEESVNYGRSQSLNDLAHEHDHDCIANEAVVNSTLKHTHEKDEVDDSRSFEDHADRDSLLSYQDIDTQRLLRNAQRLIESINETLSKSENFTDVDLAATGVLEDKVDCGDAVQQNMAASLDKDTSAEQQLDDVSSIEDALAKKSSANSSHGIVRNDNNVTDKNPISDMLSYKLMRYSSNMYSPGSETIPSITEEYSTTAIFQRNSLTEDTVKKWAAQLLIALDILHQNGVICRDLNPDNILLSDDGSIKLTYFYRYPNIDTTFNYSASDRLYTAPEVTPYSGASFAADWWSFGAILYELITLKSLFDSQIDGINSHTIIGIPDNISMESKSLLTNLLKYDPNDRLGSGISGADDIKAHPYFAGICWDDL